MVRAVILRSGVIELEVIQGHSAVLLGKTVRSHSASPALPEKRVPANVGKEGSYDGTASNSGGSTNTPRRFMLQKMSYIPTELM